MNRNAKRAVTLLIILTMVIGMFPAMGFAVAGDLEPPIVCHDETDPDDSGDRGVDWGQGVGYPLWETLKVQKGNTLAIIEGQSGQVGSGSIIAVYWDKIGAWDESNQKGYLNETEGSPAGNYEVWLDVPEGVYGSHYIWVKNLDSGDYAQTEVYVIPKVKASPGSGLEDDRVTITANGLKKDKETAILFSEDDYFYDIQCTPRSEDLTDGTAADEIDGDLSYTPIKPGSVVINLESYPSGEGWLVDIPNYGEWDEGQPDGKLYYEGTDEDVGVVNYINGEYEFEVDSNTEAYAWYCVFDDLSNPDVWLIDKGGDSDDVGSISDGTDVPDTDWVSGDEPLELYFYVYDETGKWGMDDFDVGATVSVEPEEFATGDIVTIRGRGFPEEVTIPEGSVTMERGDDSWEMEFKSGDDEMTNDNGEFRFNVIVPETGKEKDDFVVLVDFGGVDAESGDVEVTDLAKITVEPDYGSQGRTITITGKNFADVRDYTYEIWYVNVADDWEYIEDVDVNSRGEFEVEIRIPAAPDGMYDFVVGDYNLVHADPPTGKSYIEADTSFRIGTILVLLSEDAAPTGTEIIMTGNGFSEGESWNATFGDLVLYEDESVDNNGLLKEGSSIPKFYVPQVEPGTYTITVTDMETDIQVDVPFEVTKTTYAELNANNVPTKFNLTISGYFWAATGGDLDMVLYNDTDYWTMDPLWMWDHDSDDDTDRVEEEARKWMDDANFTVFWEILTSDDLDKGDYTINITDDEDFLIQLPLTIGDKVQSIVPRKSSFAIGEQVAFDIMHSFTLDDKSYIKIFDPDGELYWRVDDIEGWEREGPYYWVPYAEQTSNGNEMWLLEDAPLGEWSFIWYEDDGDKLESGTFGVTESPGDVLSGQIEDVNAAIAGLQDDIQGVSDDMAGLQGDIADAVSAANAATSAANAAVDAVNAIAATAGDAAEAAQAASEAANEARKAAGGLTTLVYGAIGASLVAALAAIVSLMQISRRIAG